jgi:hypothetical protein
LRPASSSNNTNLDVASILSSIRKVEADADWDGISAAVQIKMHYPKVDVRIGNSKEVTSDIHTLVLDQGTKGEGWVVDHHPINAKCKNLLSFCESGEKPTSTLVYNLLPEKNDTDLMLSATAEITDGLYSYGLESGSLKLLSKKDSYYFRDSNRSTQYMVDKEIYAMADIFALISLHIPQAALRVGIEAYESRPKNVEELTALLNKNEAGLVEDYFAFMRNFSEDHFKYYKIDNYDVRIGEARNIGKFSYFALSRMLTKYPGNYILFRGKRVSMRTNDQKLFDTTVKVLDKNVVSYGGRKGWHGIILKEEMSYRKFLGIMEKGIVSK